MEAHHLKSRKQHQQLERGEEKHGNWHIHSSLKFTEMELHPSRLGTQLKMPSIHKLETYEGGPWRPEQRQEQLQQTTSLSFLCLEEFSYLLQVISTIDCAVCYRYSYLYRAFALALVLFVRGGIEEEFADFGEHSLAYGVTKT